MSAKSIESRNERHATGLGRRSFIAVEPASTVATLDNSQPEIVSCRTLILRRLAAPSVLAIEMRMKKVWATTSLKRIVIEPSGTPAPISRAGGAQNNVDDFTDRWHLPADSPKGEHFKFVKRGLR